MYICKECGHVFKEPVIVRDDPSPQGVGLTSGEYHYEVCPVCESDDIGEATECACCGEWYDVDDRCSVVCNECLEGLEQELDEVRIRNGLTDDDFQEAIATIFGW